MRDGWVFAFVFLGGVVVLGSLEELELVFLEMGADLGGVACADIFGDFLDALFPVHLQSRQKALVLLGGPHVLDLFLFRLSRLIRRLQGAVELWILLLTSYFRTYIGLEQMWVLHRELI